MDQRREAASFHLALLHGARPGRTRFGRISPVRTGEGRALLPLLLPSSRCRSDGWDSRSRATPVSAELLSWCESNKNRYYVREWLLELWNMQVEPGLNWESAERPAKTPPLKENPTVRLTMTRLGRATKSLPPAQSIGGGLILSKAYLSSVSRLAEQIR